MRMRIALMCLTGTFVLAAGCAETEQVMVEPDSLNVVQDDLAKGNDYADRGLTEKAESAYRAAIVSNPRDTRAYVNLAQLYVDTGRSTEAEQVLEESLKVNPREMRAHNLLGHIYYENKAYNTARYHYRKALEVNPDYYQAHWNLVATCLMLNKDQEAFEHCRRYI